MKVDGTGQVEVLARGTGTVAPHVPVRGLGGSLPVIPDHLPLALVSQMRCSHQIYFCKKISLNLLELFLAAGAFLPSSQLCKTPKEQRLNLARANQLCYSPKIAYFTDLKPEKNQKKPKTTITSHLNQAKKPFKTLHPCSARMATSAIRQSKPDWPTAAAGTRCQPLGGFSLGTQCVLEVVELLPLPLSMPWHHHVVCNDGNGCRRESSSWGPEQRWRGGAAGGRSAVALFRQSWGQPSSPQWFKFVLLTHPLLFFTNGK